MAERNELPDEVKVFIVQALACYDTPSVVAAAVKDEFAGGDYPETGLVVSRQAVHAYDPTKKAGAALSDKLKAIFTETREAFLADTSQIGIAQKSVRLRMLDRAARKAEASGNIMGMAEICERAAKEVGGAFTNRREMSGPDGKPIEVRKVDEFSDEELLAIAARGRAGGDAKSDNAATSGSGSAPAPAGAVEPGGVRERDTDPGKAGD